MTSTGSANRARPDKVTAIAVWFIINAIIPFLGAAAILIFALPAVIRGSMGNPNGYLGIIGVSFGLLLVAGLCALNVAAAVGLLQLREWARWVAIALAALGLPLIPVHTVVGGLIIWYPFFLPHLQFFFLR